jgi:hypothetical protein
VFVHYNGKVVNANTITRVDYSDLAQHGWVRVYNNLNLPELVEGPQAFDLLMRLCPSALEGEGAREQRGRWAIHNFFGHPLMQLFSWLGWTKLGLKIHDATVPNPITK